MDFKNISDNDLLVLILVMARKEQSLTLELLEHLREVQARRVFAKMSYSSLWEYTVKYLGYSESGASERLNALKLLKAVPEIKDQLEEGTLNLTTVSTVQRFVQASEKENNKTYSPEEKLKIIREVAGKSKRETEKILEARTEVKIVPKEQIKSRKVSETEVASELRFLASPKLMKQIERFMELHGNLPLNDIFETAMEGHLSKKDIKEKVVKSNKTAPLWPAKVTRYNRIEIKKKVFQRANYQCQFVSPTSGKRCECKTKLQIDHIIPIAQGGSVDLANLRVVCPTHNQFLAIRFFGEQKMKEYVKDLS